MGVTDEFLNSMVKSLKNLKELNLYALPYLKCDFLKILAEKNENCKIEFLDLCGNQQVDDQIFENFTNSRALKKLKYLNLSWCSKVTDSSFQAIAPNLDNLELLSLHGLLGITDKTIENLHSNEKLRNKLNTLDVYGCANVLDKEKEKLLEKFPRLTCFKYHF